MITRLLVAILLLPCLLYAGQGMGPGPGFKTYSAGASDFCASATSTPGTTGVLCEDFEGDQSCYSGYTSNCRATWATASATGLNFQQTGLDGTYSLSLPAYTTSGDKYAGRGWTESTGDTHEIYSKIKAIETPAVGTTKNIADIRGADGNSLIGSVFFTNNGSAVVFSILPSGGTQVSTVATVTEGTTYNVWIKHIVGTGANAEIHLAFSTTSTKPTDGQNGYAKSTNGTSTLTADRFKPNVEYSSGGQCSDIDMDNIFVDNAVISGVPQ